MRYFHSRNFKYSRPPFLAFLDSIALNYTLSKGKKLSWDFNFKTFVFGNFVENLFKFNFSIETYVKVSVFGGNKIALSC